LKERQRALTQPYRPKKFKPLHNQDTHSGPSFSLGNRLARVAWGIAAALLFRPSPRPLHAWRALLLRAFGASIGKGVHVYPGARIWAPWNLEIADGAGVANGAILYTQGKITIGKKAVISQGAHLCAGTHDFTHPGFPLVTKPIVIGDHVWIAAEAFVHPGVTIGEGTVVGARSVVTKSLPPWKVCSGFPAAPLKDRVLSSAV
jgi:putative colanic acid biosynthesis acetyltransferase WcaF